MTKKYIITPAVIELVEALYDEWEKHNHGWGRKRYSGRGTKVLDRRFEWWGIKEFPIQP